MLMNQQTKIALAWELHKSGINNCQISTSLGIHRETIGIWIYGVREFGLLGYIDKHLQAKKGPRIKRQIDPMIKKWIYDIREREKQCCGQKIKYHLKKDKGIVVAVSKIYEVLGEKYQLRSKWKKNVKRGVVPIAIQARQVVQMDTIDFGEIFAFTAVDIFSKEVDVMLRPSLTAKDGQFFLHSSMERRFNNFSEIIQTDGGPEFKAEFHQDSHLFSDRHRIARAYKKNEQSYIESFNRSFRKECLGWTKYKTNQISDLNVEVESYLRWYHYQRPHLGLNLKTLLLI